MEDPTHVPLAGNWLMVFRRPPYKVEVETAEAHFRQQFENMKPGETLIFHNGQTVTLKLNIEG